MERLGDDGRVVFLDFGLMDRMDFGLMESCASGVRQVLNKDWRLGEQRLFKASLAWRRPKRARYTSNQIYLIYYY